MQEIRLKIFSDYTTPTVAKGAFKSWGLGNTTYKNITVVDDESYTHACIFNHGKLPQLKVPKENVVGFHQEVYELIDMNKYREWVDKHVGTYFVYDLRYMNGPNIKEWYTFLPNIPLVKDFSGYTNPEKPQKMSIIASNKKFLPGHNLRHGLIKKILASDMDIHVYGRGSRELYPLDGRVKGEIADKTLAFRDYKMNIAIENKRMPYWITEKFVDPIICDCVPLYWGANHCHHVFGEETHYKLSDDVNDIFNTIKNAYYNTDQFVNNKSTKVAQDKLLGEANFAEFIIKHFSK